MVRLPLIAHRQIVCGKLTKVFPFAIVTYCVQQTGVYTGGPTGVYTGVPNGGYPYPAGARPATARPARPNWPKAAAALALAALSTALADAKVRGMALSAVSPILNIAGPRVFNPSAYGSCMALVREFTAQSPIWSPHLRRRRHRRGNRHPLRLDVPATIFRVGSFPHSSAW